MESAWATSSLAGANELLFESFHTGLQVSLIGTPRNELKTCRSSEFVSEVVRRNIEAYDFLPVVEDNGAGAPPIIGLLHAAPYARKDPAKIEGRVDEKFSRLSEEFIIGGDSSILEFIKDADARPCRLIVSGSNIAGLVSLSDLQKLPVRAVLFALVTGLEITMMDAIRRLYKDDGNWLTVLSPGRRSLIEEQTKEAKAIDSFVNTLLFTQFCDKKTLIKHHGLKSRSKSSIEQTLSEIEALRNNIAHANDYAKTPQEAREICKTIRDLLEIRSEISAL
jgi:hypothetical protein